MRADEARANREKKAELLFKMLELSKQMPDEENLGSLLEERQLLMNEMVMLDAEYDFDGHTDETTDQRIKELLEELVRRDRKLFSFAMRTLENMKHEITAQRRQLKRAGTYAGAYSPQSQYIDRKE